VQVLQLPAGVDAQFGAEQGAQRGVLGQRLRPCPAAVQRPQVRRPQPFPQRVRGDGRRQLGGQPGVVAEGQPRLRVVLGRGQPGLGEPGHLDGEPGEIGQVFQWRAAPQGERPAEPVGGTHRRVLPESLPALGGQGGEEQRVALALGDVQAVTAGGVGETSAVGLVDGVEDPAERGNVRVEVRPCGRRRVVAPEHLDQVGGAHHRARSQQQHGQQGALLAAAHRDELTTRPAHLEAAQSVKQHGIPSVHCPQSIATAFCRFAVACTTLTGHCLGRRRMAGKRGLSPVLTFLPREPFRGVTVGFPAATTRYRRVTATANSGCPAGQLSAIEACAS
jgi:hypothetical protein